MFYEVRDELYEIEPGQIDPNRLTVGCVTGEELRIIGKELGFDEDTIAASQRANPRFRTGVDVHSEYTFAELRIIDHSVQEDFVSIYIKNNLLLIVDIIDEDKSTISNFLKAVQKYPCSKITAERVLFSFIDSLLLAGNMISEQIRDRLTDMEEAIVKDEAEEAFNIDLLELKKTILKYYNFYGQILDITETLEENDNEILNPDNLIYIANLTNKVTRLRDDMTNLNSIADHIQDAYAAMLDLRMNNTMKVFTIITTIFFPLTIIVGWYGMNFTYMPELAWRYGYVYVTALSVLVVAVLVLIGKRKKWF